MVTNLSNISILATSFKNVWRRTREKYATEKYCYCVLIVAKRGLAII